MTPSAGAWCCPTTRCRACRRTIPSSTEAIRSHFAYWDDIAVVHKGVRTVSGGHGFAGIGRKQMLVLLQARARELGVDLRFETEFKSAEDYRKDYDLVVACDGINSLVRREYADVFKPDIDTRLCKFVWLGTHQKFNDAFTFIFEKTEHGWVWAHVYQFDDKTATFIVECLPETWDRWGFAAMSKEETVATCERIFAKHLDGHALMSNAAHLRGSAVWMQFPRVICETLVPQQCGADGRRGGHRAFLHRLRLAPGLRFGNRPCRLSAFGANAGTGLSSAIRKSGAWKCLRMQSAARNSLEWFEQVERYLDMPSEQFAYSLLTRSQRISHENLRLRDPKWLRGVEDWFQRQSGGTEGRAPMFAPFKLRDMTLANRVVVSPMAQYKAVDGCPTDWHFVHYAERAKGGAGLVYMEMTCVSAEGRISPGCTGLYAPEHEAQWKRLTDFVHAETGAKICCQIGHAGRKASTRVGWEEDNAPLAAGNWPVMSASAIAWSPRNQLPKAMDREDMDKVTAQFVVGNGDGEARGLRHDRTSRRPWLSHLVVHLAQVEHPQR